MMDTIVDGVIRPMTSEELAQIEADKLAIAQAQPATPTKEELLAQLNAIAAQIQSLGA
jgi:hypothetical protein